MFLFVLRKIASNRWKVLCLLAGSILVVAMLSSIPIYTNGTLQRMLIKEMEQYQVDSGRYPGYYVIESRLNLSGGNPRQDFYRKLEDLAVRTPSDYVSGSISTYGRIVELASISRKTVDASGRAIRIPLSAKHVMGFEQKVELVTGRMYSPSAQDGVIEAVVTERFYRDQEMTLDKVYDIFATTELSTPLFQLRIVGIIKLTDPAALYWYQNEQLLGSSLMIGEASLFSIVALESGDRTLEKATWFYAYDYHRMRVEQTNAVLEGYQRQTDDFFKFSPVSPVTFPLAKILEVYPAREARLLLTLSILIIPIVLMLVFYIFMISQLKVQGELNEISVFQSRGARRGQILRIYLLESVLLGGVSLLLGPPLGLLMCQVLGASNGFLEFVNRKGLPLEIGSSAILAGLGAVFLFILTTLIPVLTNAKLSIVAQKRLRSHKLRAPLWQRLFLDVMLMAIASYGLYTMNMQLKALSDTAKVASAGNVDFLLYLASTVFVLGAGLLFLRLYPWIIRMVSKAGSRIWSPVAFASFHQVAQRDGQAAFLMLFLILSLSIGIFSADSARTINRHVEDNIRGNIGTDLRLLPSWYRYGTDGFVIQEEDAGSGGGAAVSSSQIVYHEPDFSVYKKLEGIDHSTRVLNKSKIGVKFNSQISSDVQLLGIDPYDFAQTAWTRSGLNPYHLNEYMNVLTTQPKSVILSTSLKALLSIDIGDSVMISDRSASYEGVVIAFVNYWPGYTPRVINLSGDVRVNHLVIANLEYVYRYTPMEPYEVWLDKSADTSDRVVYDSIAKNRVSTSRILSTSQDIVRQKNDLILQGTNGMFSLGFIVSMLICAIGFLIYWILSIQGRVLQFGIFRAMGMSKKSIIGMILTEQLLISGVAIAVGLAIGKLSGLLFVPLFKLVYASPDQPIPFQVIAYASDYGKILIVVGAILLVGFLVLTRLILKIRIDQAVKLGED